MSTASNTLAIPTIIPRIPVDPTLGFGERAPGWTQKTTCNKVWKVALPILLGTLTICAVALVGAILALPVAACVSSAAIIALGAKTGAFVGFVGLGVLAIYAVINRYRPTPNLSYLKLNAAYHGVTPLGQFNGNNSVLVTSNAKETTEWKLDLMREAKQSIEISGNFCGGPIFDEALDIMEAAVKRDPNFRVHLITSTFLLTSAEKARLKYLAKTYPNFHCLKTSELIDFSPTLRTRGNHVKLLVVDETYYVVGGTNLYRMMGSTTGDRPAECLTGASRIDRFLGAGYRDTDVIAKGELAKTLRLEFFKLWAVWEHKMTGKMPKRRFFAIDPDPTRIADSQKWAKAESENRVRRHVRVKALVCDPDKPNAITDACARLVRQATKTVEVANFTFNPTREVADELNRAVRRKVKVRVVTNGVHENAPPANANFVKGNYPNYLPLLIGRRVTRYDTRASLIAAHKPQYARIYEYVLKNIMYHSKFLTIDGKTLLIGSYNWGKKSDECDFELNLEIESPEVVQDILNNFESDIKRSRKVTIANAYELSRSWMGKLQAALFGFFN